MRVAFVSVALLLMACGSSDEPGFRPVGAAEAELREPREHREPAGARVVPMGEEPFPPDDERMPNLQPFDDSAPRPSVVLAPSDMSTATFGTLPTITVAARGLSPAEVALFAARFELVTWPERVRVPTTPVYLDQAVEPSQSSDIVLQPDEPLEERWYALRGVPPDGQTPDPKNNPIDGDGKSVSRFFVGRLPGVQRVLAAARDAGGGDIEIFYSERVREHASHAHIEVEIDGDVEHCQVGNRRELGSEEGAMVVWLVCPAIEPGSLVRITHRHPMEGAFGDLVTAPDGSELPPVVITVPGALGGARSASASDPETATDSSSDGSGPVEVYVPAFGLAGSGV